MVGKSHIRLGDKIENRYVVESLIGAGGMSFVYLVRDLRLNKYWALKEVPILNNKKGAQLLQSVTEEVALLSKLNHRGIPSIKDVFRTPYSLLIVMDYISGYNLHEAMTLGEVAYFEEKTLVKWFKELGGILKYLHNRTPMVVFRDMKPHNVMLTDNKYLMLLDFGISREVTPDYDFQKEPLAYTLGYSPPEQVAKNKWFDARSDIFALGRTFFYLSTKVSPRTIIDSGETFHPVRFYRKDLSVGLERVIEKCTQLDPKERYQSVEELLYDLDHLDDFSEEHQARLNFRFKWLLTSASALVLGSALLVGGYVGSNYATGQTFETYLEQGLSTGDREALKEAITLNPTDTRPYLALLKTYQEDASFTPSEEVEVLDVLLPHLRELKGIENSGQILFQLGQLYWFYYEENGQVKAVSWFEQASRYGLTGKDKTLNSIYLELGRFKKTILTSITDQSDAGSYKAYVGALDRLEKEMIGKTNLQVLYGVSVLTFLDTYTGGLKADGYSLEQAMSLYDKGVSTLNGLGQLTPLQSSQVEQVRGQLEQIKAKVNSSYGVR